MKFKLALAAVALLLQLVSTAEVPEASDRIYTDAAAGDCPLDDISFLNYDSHCFEEKHNATVLVYGSNIGYCCLDVFLGFSRLLATYANNSRHLFLTKSQGRACLLQLSNTSSCSQPAEQFTEGTSPCAFASVGDLSSAIQMAVPPNPNPISIDSILNDCTGAQLNSDINCSVCLASFSRAANGLGRSLNTSDYICAGALLVGLASLRVGYPLWLESLYGCVVPHVHDSSPARNTDYLFVVVIATIGGVLVAAAAFIIYKRKRRNTCEKFDEFDRKIVKEDVVHSEGLYTFSAQEIRRATNNFSEENFLGQGSAGQVFKGVLPSGQFVAVKRIDEAKKLDTFQTELKSLCKVRHAHLVTLLGHCQFGAECYLVYEFCSRGNLSQWLFADDGRVLSWEQRLKIAVNSARGLWFLHNYPGGSIIHRDVKPTNILLNEQLEAKLSDFGLARYIALEESTVFTEVKGTAGYLDPEYVNMGKLTQASDVYSFGIVLLQLISGRRAIDLDPNHRLSLVKTAQQLAQKGEDLETFVDPRLEGWYSQQVLYNLFDVALSCTCYSRMERPTMVEVLGRLEDASHSSIYEAMRMNQMLDKDEEAYTSPSSLRQNNSHSTLGYSH